MKVPFFCLDRQYEEIKDEIIESLRRILDKTCFIGGEYVGAFENQIKEYLGVKHAISCSNGTDALILGLRACGVNAGDEVITTPFSFFATAEAIAAIGAIPVFVDINYGDYNINVDLIEKAITPKTKAILPVHIFGAPADMIKICEIAQKYGIKVIEDTAQGIGSEVNEKKAGTIGDVGCFSFYPTKNLGGAGDGGMVVTNDDELATVLLALREHGAGENGVKAVKYLYGVDEEIQNDERIDALYNPYKYYNYLIGYNSRLDAFQAAVLSVKLKKLDDYNKKRTMIADVYKRELTDKVRLPMYDKNINPCWHQFVILSEKKNELSQYMNEKGVGVGAFYPIPLHQQKAFTDKNSRTSGERLLIAEKVSRQSVCLPIFPEMTEEEVGYVVSTFNGFYN